MVTWTGPRFVASLFARWARWSWPGLVVLKGRAVGATTLEGAVSALAALNNARVPDPWCPAPNEGDPRW